MIQYKYNSLFDKFMRKLGSDKRGWLICSECKKDFFNLWASELCYECWCKINKVDPF